MAEGWDVADLQDPLEGTELSEPAMGLTRAKEGKLERLLEAITHSPPSVAELIHGHLP